MEGTKNKSAVTSLFRGVLAPKGGSKFRSDFKTKNDSENYFCFASEIHK